MEGMLFFTLAHARTIMPPISTIYNPVNTQSMVTIAKENVNNVSLHVPGVHPAVALTLGHGIYVSACTLAQVPYTQTLPEITSNVLNDRQIRSIVKTCIIARFLPL